MREDLKRAAIVVPCYNEEKRLRPAEFTRCLETTDVHFVFVNDGSQDNTRELLQVLAAAYPTRISILTYNINRGKAEAVRLGINFAISRQVEFVGFWDADLATPLDELAHFIDVLTERAEVEMVLGSRVKLLGRNIERRALRHYLGRLFATVVSNVLQLPVYDTQCGAKLLRVTPRVRWLFTAPFTSRWVFDVEMIARYIQQVGSAGAAANHIYEFPLHTWTDVAGSKLKATDFVVALNDIARIYFRHLRG